MIARRQMMLLAAAALATPGRAATVLDWQGRGLGGALSLRLVGADPAQGPRLFRRVEAEVERIESLFSLHRDSALTRLNRDGRLAHPTPEMLQVLALAGAVHRATGGLFDPTVQPLWRALAEGADPAPARARIGWDRVEIGPEEVRLGPGMGMTLNGIVQGWAADRIAALVRAAGFQDVLIDMGEIAALGRRPDGRAWQAGIATPGGEQIGTAALSDRALATSAPFGSPLGGAGGPHILGPKGEAPQWETVSISAPQAAVADALSTACCLLPRDGIDRAVSAFPGARLELARPFDRTFLPN